MEAAKSIEQVVRHIVKKKGQIPLHGHTIGDAEIEFVARTLRDDPVGYSRVEQFTAMLESLCGVQYVLAVNSGTSALHLALMVAGVEAFTEVLVPALTFVGTANAVAHIGAIPNLVDVRGYDLGIAPFKLGRYLQSICERRNGGTYNRRSGRKITALIAVDLLGTPCDMDAIKEECARFAIPVIEDAAQALGSKYKGKPCGSNAFIGILSFNKNKIVTTDGGGALLTDDPMIMSRAYWLATTAREAHAWKMQHTEVAWNYRMGNVNAALGIPQLQRLDELVEKKRKLHEAYAKHFNVTLDVENPIREQTVISNHWLNAILLEPLDRTRDEKLNALSRDGIGCRTLFTPLNELPMYKTVPRDNLESAIGVWHRAICLPSGANLGDSL